MDLAKGTGDTSELSLPHPTLQLPSPLLHPLDHGVVVEKALNTVVCSPVLIDVNKRIRAMASVWPRSTSRSPSQWYSAAALLTSCSERHARRPGYFADVFFVDINCGNSVQKRKWRNLTQGEGKVLTASYSHANCTVRLLLLLFQGTG